MSPRIPSARMAAIAAFALSTLVPLGPAAARTRGCDNLEPVPIAGALFTARPTERDPREVHWEARYIVDADAAFDFKGGALALAVPLPPGESVTEAPGVTPVLENDRVIGLCLGPAAIHDRTIAVELVQPRRQDTVGPLGAPVARGSTVQIVDTQSADARIEITTRGFERNVGFVATPGVSHGAREEARRLTATRARLTRSPVFVRGDDLEHGGGLEGRIVDERQRAHGSALGVGLVFVAVVSGLVVAAQRLRRSAQIEHADAVLASACEQGKR